jgi:hypothetical protein
LVEQIAEDLLPVGYGIDWTAQALQEKRAATSALPAFLLALLMVFLILAALYEDLALPLGVLLTVPFALLGALLAIFTRGMPNDIYFQIGLVTLIGLAAKNAILIVEFAESARRAGRSAAEAAIEAARMRIRPLVMTSMAFVLGVVPLAFAGGAGAAARQSMGTGVLGACSSTRSWPRSSSLGSSTFFRPQGEGRRPAMKPFFSLLFVAGMPAGCALGPDYQRPAVPSADAYPEAGKGGKAVRADWWKSFGDPELDALVAKAFAANADLRQAVARVEEAAAVLGEVEGARLPQVDASVTSAADQECAGRRRLRSEPRPERPRPHEPAGRPVHFVRARFLGPAAPAPRKALAARLLQAEEGRRASSAWPSAAPRSSPPTPSLAPPTCAPPRPPRSSPPARPKPPWWPVASPSAPPDRPTSRPPKSSVPRPSRVFPPPGAPARRPNTCSARSPASRRSSSRPRTGEALRLPAAVAAGLFPTCAPSTRRARGGTGAGRRQRPDRLHQGLPFPDLFAHRFAGQPKVPDLETIFGPRHSTTLLGLGMQLPVFDAGRGAARVDAAVAARNQAAAAYEQAVLNAFREVRDALVDVRETGAAAVAAERRAGPPVKLSASPKPARAPVRPDLPNCSSRAVTRPNHRPRSRKSASSGSPRRWTSSARWAEPVRTSPPDDRRRSRLPSLGPGVWVGACPRRPISGRSSRRPSGRTASCWRPASYFALAILHAFVAPLLARAAHRLEEAHREAVREGRAPVNERGESSSLRAAVMHLLGEVEAVFGIWTFVLFGLLIAWPGKGWDFACRYVESGDYAAVLAGAAPAGPSKFIEPLFVFIIMTLAAARPVMTLAARLLGGVAWLLGDGVAARWFVILTLAPLLGSLITEPAAMTIGALLLSSQFYALRPSERLKYATLALLFVNISVGGALTNFAAPPIVMVAGKWGWSTADVFAHYGWAALAAILVSNLTYLLVFRRKLAGLKAEAAAPKREAIPLWVTVFHLLLMVWTVAMLAGHHPILMTGGLLVFLAFTVATPQWQDAVRAAAGRVLVGFFLAGLVVLGGTRGVVDLAGHS